MGRPQMQDAATESLGRGIRSSSGGLATTRTQRFASA